MRKYVIIILLLFSLSILAAEDYIIGTGTGNQNYIPFMVVIITVGAGSFLLRMNYWRQE